jgi:hypothetical protein
MRLSKITFAQPVPDGSAFGRTEFAEPDYHIEVTEGLVVINRNTYQTHIDAQGNAKRRRIEPPLVYSAGRLGVGQAYVGEESWEPCESSTPVEEMARYIAQECPEASAENATQFMQAKPVKRGKRNG